MTLHINTFDRYQSATSLIHRFDPRLKVVLTVLFIVGNVLLPDGAWPAFLLAWVLLLLLNPLASLSLTYSLKRSFIVLPFALAAVTSIFTLPGRPLLLIHGLPWSLTATDAGLIRFASIMIRSWLSVQMAILLTATTTFPDLMHALRHLRVPLPLVAIISFMYRYLFVLSDEALRLLRAREARSARLPGRRSGGSLWWRARVAGHMAGQLFLRSYERSERIYQAMVARGYRGHFLTLNPHSLHGRDRWALLVGLLCLLLIQLVGRWPLPLMR
jgi:cobalt/nickel transport system permease protein